MMSMKKIGGMALLALLVVSLPAVVSGQQDIKAKLQLLKGEPNVRAVQEAALRYFRVNRDQVTSMRSRAGWKALLPVAEISGGYTRSKLDEDTINLEFDANSPWIVRGAGGTGYEVRSKLSWNLPQLVFNAEELDVASLAGLIEGMLKETTRLYFMRRRLQIDMILTPANDLATLLTKRLRLEELTALLDAMTGGWFQSALDRASRTSALKKAIPVVTRKAAGAAVPRVPQRAAPSRPTAQPKRSAKTAQRATPKTTRPVSRKMPKRRRR